MAPELPRDILDLVLAELQLDDRAEKLTVADCCLVCKGWLPSSRYRLFTNAHVDLNDYTITPFLEAADNSLFPIPLVIRSLGLSFSDRADTLGLRESLRRLCPLPLVTTLCVTSNNGVLIRNLSLLKNTFPDVSTLVLRNTSLPLHSVLHAASAFPLLKTLELDWVRVSYDDTLLASYQLPLHWNALTLDLLTDKSKDSHRFFEAILSLNPIPVFSSLSLRGIYPKDTSRLGRYLSYTGKALQYLQLQWGPSSFFKTDDDLVGLSYCTGLQVLDLVFHHASSDIAETVDKQTRG
ncbi:hypothetical protein B0H12DRAFT_236639 [Mycena haematopus]|nr:hypothetical protein B0H12DRAFT_236639 [Mycena haematopus]